MSLIKICVLFLTIVILSEGKGGEINVYVAKSNFSLCHTKNKSHYSYVENDHVVIHSFHEPFINFAWIELPKMKLHYNPNLETVELSLHPSMKGNWTFVFLYLTNATNVLDYEYIDHKYYIRETCTIHVNIDADHDILKKSLFPALIAVSALVLVLIILVIVLTVCLKSKAHQITKRFNHLEMERRNNEDPERYTTTPAQKKSMKMAQPIEEERDSCIYENPETCLSALRHTTSSAAPLVPNTPRPVHPDVISKGAGSTIHSASTLKLSGSKSPQPTLPRTKNQVIDSSKAFQQELSQMGPRSPFTTSTLNLNSAHITTNPQHTTFPRPKQMQNGKSDALPALPLPTDEVYEEMDPDSSELYEELPDVQMSRANSQNKPKIGAMLTNSQEMRKPAKPQVSEKPKRIAGPTTIPVEELIQAFKQRTATAPVKNNGPTKSLQLNPVQSESTLTPFRSKAATTAGPRPNLQMNKPEMIIKEQSHPAPLESSLAPVNNRNKPIVLSVTEAIYNNEDDGNSSDEEWLYEPLKPDRYYKNGKLP